MGKDYDETIEKLILMFDETDRDKHRDRARKLDKPVAHRPVQERAKNTCVASSDEPNSVRDTSRREKMLFYYSLLNEAILYRSKKITG